MTADQDMNETRKVAQGITAALNATNPGDPGHHQVADAIARDGAVRRHSQQLERRTTALRAAAEVTAGMSELEVQTDHNSRQHDPENPMADVIALAGEFEDWLARPSEH